MARSVRKRVLARLRTRLLLFTLLLAFSETGALPSGPRVPGLGKKNCFRFLWVLSATALHTASRRRYLTASRVRRRKCRDWYVNHLVPSSDETFRGYMRMSRETFAVVLVLLRTHAADMFRLRRGPNLLSVEVQLAMTLYRLGAYGNLARVEAVADHFGVSVGIVVKATRRVIWGLKRLASSSIVWPNTTRRAELSAWPGSHFGFDGCIGATDGTTFPLAYQPALHPWSYYDRKGRYSLNSLITCDWDDVIISNVQGCTGAAPESFVQTRGSWHKYPSAYFFAGQYLLGDKGMKYTRWVLGPYMQPELTSAERRNFNFQLARLRVRSEHTIGILNRRWSSLKELRLGIGSDKAFSHVTDWVLACCVVHNICQREHDASLEPQSGGKDPPVSLLSLAAGALEARQCVMERVCSYMRESGVYREFC